MPDRLPLPTGRSVQSAADVWYRNVQLLRLGPYYASYLVLTTSGPHRGMLFTLKMFRRPARGECPRYRAEIDLYTALGHAGVMRVHDQGVFAGRVEGVKGEYPYIITDYLPRTLAHFIGSADAGVIERLALAVQLLSVVSFLETRSPPVVHRNITPRAIYLTGRSCVLGDFGLGTATAEPDAEDRSIILDWLRSEHGSRYRTPDLVEYANSGLAVTPKSDVFQLGLVLTELFTGENPLKDSPGRGAAGPVVLDPIGVCPGRFGGGIATQLFRMLEPEPQHRPGAAELMDPWVGIFQSLCTEKLQLEGRAF